MRAVGLLGVAVADAVIVFLQMKEREAWISGAWWRGDVADALSALAVGVSIILMAELTWITLPFSVAGVLIGRWASRRFG